jgi:acylphosphatase
LNSETLLHVDITVKGEVQGVGFRHSARTMANYLHLHGYVRNCANGDVFIEAEGDQQQITDFTIWCKNGPPYADVFEVIVKKGTVKNFSSFEIKH